MLNIDALAVLPCQEDAFLGVDTADNSFDIKFASVCGI